MAINNSPRPTMVARPAANNKPAAVTAPPAAAEAKPVVKTAAKPSKVADTALTAARVIQATLGTVGGAAVGGGATFCAYLLTAGSVGFGVGVAAALVCGAIGGYLGWSALGGLAKK